MRLAYTLTYCSVCNGSGAYILSDTQDAEALLQDITYKLHFVLNEYFWVRQWSSKVTTGTL